MGERVRVERQHTERAQEVETETDAETAAKVGEAATKGEALKEELDNLLDEIDATLETNAEEFVKSYIQKGGE